MYMYLFYMCFITLMYFPKYWGGCSVVSILYCGFMQQMHGLSVCCGCKSQLGKRRGNE